MGTADECDPELRSFDVIEQHRATLVAEAIDIAREHPGLRIVGMVIEPDAPEADALRQLLPPEARNLRQGFVGAMAREIALRILGAAAPAALDWLEDDAGAGKRKLPVVYAARTRVRTASIAYEAIAT